MQKNTNTKIDPDGNCVLAIEALIVLVIAVAGAVMYKEVTAGYLKTENGKRMLKDAKQVI